MVERQTVNQGDSGSIPLNYCYFKTFVFVHLTLPVSFGGDIKSLWPLLSDVYARGSKTCYIGGKYKCVTCSGLSNSREGQLLN